MHERVIALVAILAVSFGDRRADADPAAEAKEHQVKGLRLYKTQDYDGAITEWRAAYVLVPDPDLLFAIGQAQRLKGDCSAALTTYRNVLREKVSTKQVAEVEKVIAVCEDVLKTQPVLTPAPAPAPAPAPDPVTPSEPAQPAVAPAPIDQPVVTRSPWYKDKLGVGLLAGGAAGVAVGATFFVLASSASSDADAATDYEAFGRAANLATRDRVIGAVGAGVGGALVLGAVIRFVTRSPDVAVQATVGTRRGEVTGIALGGRW